MAKVNQMNKSSTRGIFLSIAILFSIALIIIPSNSYAEEITVESIALEETTIIEVTNDSKENISTFRIWLGTDFSFKSFKTEKGWVGEKTPQGVIIFTSSESIKPGESTKFGVKTDKISSGINWKVLNIQDVEMSKGKVLPKELEKVVVNPDIKSEQPSEDVDVGIIVDVGITTESNFRIVPEKPNAGSSIRVTGDKFGALEEFDFYINAEKIGSFETDKNGHFITTMKIPAGQIADRVDFKIKDKEGKEEKISIRIGEADNRIPETENIKLTIEGIPNIVHRGDFLEISGTADPNSAITSTVTNEEGEIYVTRTAEVNSKGNWELTEPVIIPLDMPFGKYSATITDGRQNILKQWAVESDKIIIITPSTLKFDLGQIMMFNGTALPNIPIEVVIEDPLGKEIFSNIIQVDETGDVEFEFKTEQTSTKGTYTIIATQEKEKEFIYAGLGQLPSIPVNLEFDQLNYKAGDIATISFSGKPSEIISLLIIDPSDKPIGETTSITLQPDGTGSLELDLADYASGVYTAVVSKGNAQSSEIFTVGLQTGSGEIKINTTKTDYLPGDSILILGDTGANVLLSITLMDPNGDIIKERETFSDKSGKIAESSFGIPSEGKPGMWKINAKSGANFDIIEINVLATLQEGIIVSVTEGEVVAGVGKTISIKVEGAAQSVEIQIIATDGEILFDSSFPATDDGQINQPWLIPKETEPGTLTIKVKDAFNSAETTFELE